jgi:hypothetical protein
VAIVAGMTLSLTGMKTASAVPANPAASAPPYYFSGIYLVARTENACGFKTCLETPLSLMFLSPSAGKYDLSANYGPNSKIGMVLGGKSVWQPDISMSWTGKAWQGSGSWKVVYCDNNTLAPAKVTFVVHAPKSVPKGQVAYNITGTKTDVSSAGDCGYPKSSKSAQTVNSTTLQPSWWEGNCDNGHTSTALPSDNGPFTSKPGPEWHGLISCVAVNPPEQGGEYGIQTGPLGAGPPYYGDEEWQCAELAQRWLYLAFGIPNVTVPNGGQDIAVNYYDQQLKMHPGVYPLVYLTPTSPGLKPGDLRPGDVISYKGNPGVKDQEAGHVAIVVSVTYGGLHPGYTVIEQNPSDITRTIPWEPGHPGVPGPYPLASGNYQVAGWLYVTRA